MRYISIIKGKIVIFSYLLKYYVCLFIIKIFSIKNDDLWLISERGDEAKDNGYSFYKYMLSNHSNIKIKYVISKKSSDLSKIRNEDIVLYRSFKHYVYYISAKYAISTHLQGCSPNHRIFRKLEIKGLLHNRSKEVFLQHGIIKDYIPDVAKNVNPDLKLFICGAKAEYDYLLKVLGYNENEIKYTGLARYDYLINNSKNQILLMPTWRQFLFRSNNNDFSNSEFFKRYNNLINNSKLIRFLEDNKIKLVFYPHYEIQKYLNLFKTNSNVIEIASKDSYDVQILLIESSLLITDYSSVFFDFSYMKKPVLFYQFDYEKFRATQYQDGYFSYKDDGIGDIYSDEEELVDAIIESAKSKFIVSDKYLARRAKFFIYNDTKNSKRIFDEIVKL